MDHLQPLREWNPAKLWLREQFQTSIRLVNGHLIVVRFDIVSASTFTGNVVDHNMGRYLLDDDMKDHVRKNPSGAEYYADICGAIADSLNDKMRMMRDTVLGHSKMTFKILDALSSGDNASAYALTLNLGAELLDFEPRASKVWGGWVDEILKIVKLGNGPGFNSDSSNLLE